MLKQVYNVVAVLAILHLLALLGLAGFLVSSGKLDRERAETIAAVLGGEDYAPVQEEKPTTSQPTVTPVLAEAADQRIVDSTKQDGVKRLVGERLIREAADRKALVDALLLKTTKQMEDLQKQREEFEKAKKMAQEAAQTSGLEKTLELLSKMGEKQARDQLMKMQPAEAVNLLMKMKTRTAAAIFEACRTDTEKAWSVQIMQEIARQDPTQAAELDKQNRQGG